jgi:hypothetical protein
MVHTTYAKTDIYVLHILKKIDTIKKDKDTYDLSPTASAPADH